jgi:hypothetical protein
MNDCERLMETVDRFSQFIITLPADAVAEQEWGPKEVLAHLVYYHELYVNLIEATLAGVPAMPSQGRFRDLNATAIQASRGVPVPQLVERLQEANRRLVSLYDAHDPDAIVVKIKAGAKLWTLTGLVPEVEAHIRNHLDKLCRSLKAGR